MIFTGGRTDPKSLAQEDDSNHNPYILTWLWSPRQMEQESSYSRRIPNLSLWGRNQSRSLSSATITHLCLIPFVTPTLPPRPNSRSQHSHLWVSEEPHTVSENLTVSFCPYYLKWSTVPFTQAFLQQIYKVTNICFRNRCLCQNSLLLINAFPVNI